MSALPIHACYLPGLCAPALTIHAQNHTLSIDQAEALIAELQLAVVQARIAAKHAIERRARTPEEELADLTRSFDAQLSAASRRPSASPASEVSL